MMAPAARSVSVAPRAVVPTAHAAMAMPGARVTLRNGTVRPRKPAARIGSGSVPARRHFVAGETSLRANCNSAPGLGFDAVHQSAICGPGGVVPLRNVGQVPLFFPFFGGGFYLPGAAVTTNDSTAAENSPAEDVEAENREYARRYRNSQQGQTQAPVLSVDTDTAALQDSEQFVFVRRDGTLFFAVAYSWENGTLRYINSQGLRQTVNQEALDLSATQQFNEQRGLNFHSPA